MVGMPSGTLTFLFTDIEGSTELWAQHPDAMRAALERHDDILRSAVTRHHGFVFATGGDGIDAAFQRSVDAVEAAVEAQRELQSEAWPDPMVIKARMGIHTGEAQERDGNYFRAPLNRAARLMGRARRPGARFESHCRGAQPGGRDRARRSGLAPVEWPCRSDADLRGAKLRSGVGWTAPLPPVVT